MPQAASGLVRWLLNLMTRGAGWCPKEGTIASAQGMGLEGTVAGESTLVPSDPRLSLADMPTRVYFRRSPFLLPLSNRTLL